MSTRDQVNASPITKITSWFKFLGKNLNLVRCAIVCAKSEVMLRWVVGKYYITTGTAIFKKTEVAHYSLREHQGKRNKITYLADYKEPEICFIYKLKTCQMN